MCILNILKIQQHFVFFHKEISLARVLEHTQRVSKIVNSYIEKGKLLKNSESRRLICCREVPEFILFSAR